MSDCYIVRHGGTVAGGNGFPEFTYSGNYTLLDDGTEEGVQNFRLKLLTSGTLRFSSLGSAGKGIDVFLVGGGGNGWLGDYGGGGGSGYTNTVSNLVLEVDKDYEIIIGGSAGATSAFEQTANQGGNGGACPTNASGRHGGSGASGGGSRSGVGGMDGADGGNSKVTYDWSTGAAYNHYGGSGQGTTTREFGEETGDLYASGGSGYYAVAPAEGGGGQGAHYGSAAGTANTGGGGGGGAGGYGGSGIVIIRNHREVSA